MSDSDSAEQSKLTQVLGRYKSTKGDADKRKQTSKTNMAKARAAKIAQLKAKKEEEAGEIEISGTDEESESEEEEELVLTKKSLKGKGKGRGGAPASASNERMDMLEAAILALASKKQPKRKPIHKKTVIHVTPAAAVSTPKVNAGAEAMKRSIIQWD